MNADIKKVINQIQIRDLEIVKLKKALGFIKEQSGKMAFNYEEKIKGLEIENENLKNSINTLKNELVSLGYDEDDFE